MRKIKIRLNVELKGYSAGKILEIEADEEGTPLDKYWRARFKDAPYDNCITIIGNEKNNKKKEE